MNPTRDLDTADFSLHRVLFSSRQRVERTYSSSTNFKCQIDIPRGQDVFRFAIRRITFPNVANPWDLTNAPYFYYQVNAYVHNTDQLNWSGVYFVRFSTSWTKLADVPASLEAMMKQGSLYQTLSGAPPATLTGNPYMDYLSVTLATAGDTNLTFASTNKDLGVILLSIQEQLAGGDKEVSHYGNNIIGVSETSPLIRELTPGISVQSYVTPFPIILSGLLHVYLTSTTLSATARSNRPMFAPVENCIAAIPVASSYLTMVDHRPEAPTVWNCNQLNHWDVVDFQLRYDTGGLVDLGGNDIEIEIEFEIMEQFQAPPQQMREAIYVPVVNTYDTSKLLMKRDNRSWGSYGGTAGGRQFSAAGYTSRVFR